MKVETFLGSAMRCWPPCPLRLSEGGEEGAGVWRAGTFGIVTSEVPSGRQDVGRDHTPIWRAPRLLKEQTCVPQTSELHPGLQEVPPPCQWSWGLAPPPHPTGRTRG